MTTPLFLLSLPRSGSTLLQRILATHAEIHTTSEPWLMLPLLAALDEESSLAPYRHKTMARAICDFCSELPERKKTYFSAVGRFGLDLYGQVSPPGTRYFLDKTPRYHLIAKELPEIFPQAKVIVLWRNPLAVAASMIDTFGGGRFVIADYEIDLYAGLDRLLQICQGADRSRMLEVRFENLLDDPQAVLAQVARYLDLDLGGLDPELIHKISLKGRMGDPTGVKQYVGINREPMEKWKVTMANPLRKAWCRSYLRWLGPARLGAMGYDYASLVRELADIPLDMRHFASDVFRWLFGKLNALLELRLLRYKASQLQRGKRIYSYR